MGFGQVACLNGVSLCVRREILVFDFRGKVAVGGLERVERCSGSGNFPFFLLIEGENVLKLERY